MYRQQLIADLERLAESKERIARRNAPKSANGPTCDGTDVHKYFRAARDAESLRQAADLLRQTE